MRTFFARRLLAGRSFAALSALLAAGLSPAGDARADSVAQLQIFKRLTAETIALIDPQGGTSMGGASTNINYAIGDVLTFRIAFTPVPNGATRGLGGYITEYVPGNTEVVGARIVDRYGNTVYPHRGGFGAVGWGPRGAEGYSLPLQEGGISSLYADTGVFFSTDARTARNPSATFISLTNGILMSPSPTGAGQFDQLLGIVGNNYYAHNSWDWIQVRAFGVGGGSLGNGTGNTPFGYGSAVAGPDTFYAFEATEVGGVPQASGLAGPWQRVRTPGAEIGTGVPATSAGLPDRLGVLTNAGATLSTDAPLPSGTNAVRFAVGELVVGDEYFAEVSLRVLGSPLDPVQGDDVNCTEVFGGDASSRNQAGSQGGKDNTWRYFVPSPSCVKLDLRFELDVDKVMALPNDIVTYTLTTQNLSLQPRTNVVVAQDLSTTNDLSLSSATGNPNINGDVLTWPAMDLQPGDVVVHTIVTNVSGGGDSTTSVATYTADQLPAPGFQVQTLTTISPIANLDLAMAAAPQVTTAGSTVTYTATIENAGTGVANVTGCGAPGCAAIVQLPAGFSYVPGTTTVNGAAAGDPTVGTNLRFSAGLVSIAPGATLTLAFDAAIAGGTPDGVYRSSLETWLRDPGPGQDVEDAIFQVAPVYVGVVPSDVPTVDPGLVTGDIQVCGTTTEADGTLITVYVDLQPVGTTTSAAGSWCVTVPSLYAGQDVSATAQASGEVESGLSTPPEEVLGVGVTFCSDGLDNDGDGLTDFPADPGCTSPTDLDETDVPECSDGLDNDGDGLVDFPNDPGCSSYLDATELGPPACSDGVDDDGDGLTDFPADPGCTDANDVSEQDLAACANGVDDDADGLVDYPLDPGCSSAFDDDETATSGQGGGGGGSVGVGVGPAGVGGGGEITNGVPPDQGGVPGDETETGGADGCDCAVDGARGDGRGLLGVLVLVAAVARRRRRGGST